VVISLRQLRLGLPRVTAAALLLAASPLIAKAQPVPPGDQYPGTGGNPPNTASSGPGTEPAQKQSESIWTRDTLTGDWNGWRTKLEDAGVRLQLQEQSELWGNLAGGVHRGVVYNGLTTGSIAFDLEKLLGWTGAKFFVNAYQIHGRGPSANLAGNLQLVSNIEATRDTKLYDLWLEQSLLDNKLNVRIGQEGANDEMMTTQYGALFLNSSFGFPGLPAADLPSGGPNYPMATPFVRARYDVSDRFTLVGAVFNGDPAPPGGGDPQLRDRGGTAFRLNDHVLAFAELWYSTNQGEHATGLPGTYKLGAWFSSSRYTDELRATNGLSLANPASSGVAVGHSSNYAIYGIIDQMVWQRPGTQDQGIGLFLQVMGAPGGYNLANLFVLAGMNWKAPFAAREQDVFGLGVAYLGISPAARRFSNDIVFFTGRGSLYRSNETVLEATYLYQVTPWWTLQPDAQFVINPGAGIPSAVSAVPLKNAFLLGVRATVQF
jgi:porin